MEKASLMQEEIKEKRKLTQDVKEKIDKSTLYNFIICVAIMAFTCTINYIYLNTDVHLFELILKIFSIVIITITVILFEIAYRKDSTAIWITGIEFFVYSIALLYLNYVYLYQTEIYKGFIMILPIFFAVYYIAKELIIYRKMEKYHLNNLSDVKEILKEREESYLDEKSTKTLREQKGKK